MCLCVCACYLIYDNRELSANSTQMEKCQNSARGNCDNKVEDENVAFIVPVE